MQMAKRPHKAKMRRRECNDGLRRIRQNLYLPSPPPTGLDVDFDKHTGPPPPCPHPQPVVGRWSDPHPLHPQGGPLTTPTPLLSFRSNPPLHGIPVEGRGCRLPEAGPGGGSMYARPWMDPPPVLYAGVQPGCDDPRSVSAGAGDPFSHRANGDISQVGHGAPPPSPPSGCHFELVAPVTCNGCDPHPFVVWTLLTISMGIRQTFEGPPPAGRGGGGQRIPPFPTGLSLEPGAPFPGVGWRVAEILPVTVTHKKYGK